MFDDRLQDIIMQEMMAEFGADVRTDEGSLAYNACVKIAEKLEEVYGDMDIISDNMIPSTQDEFHLITYGKERGIEYRYATCPVVRGVFHQEIEIGERFTCNDYTYEVIEKISDYEYRMQCDAEGVEANTNMGDLEPEDYVDEYLGGQITEILVQGEDDEDIEQYREKVINAFKTTSFGGNKADYRRFVNAIDGVGGCKPKRREADSPWINIHVISSTYEVPSADLINQIQTAVDPEQNSGEGDGMAPICHHVKILAVESEMINVSTSITFDAGYNIQTSQSVIESVVKEYLNELCQTWESRELDSTVVRISQIEAKIISVEGVLDIAGTKINGSADNLVIDYSKIPVFGGVNVNV